MAHTFRLRQSSTTLVDFQDVTDFGLRNWSLYAMGAPYGQARIVLDVRGSSANDLFDNLIALQRALELCLSNWRAYETGTNYTPVYLQFQEVTASNLVQAECFGLDESEGALENILAKPETILANRLENITLNLKIRGYFQETSAQSLDTDSHSNAAGTSTAGASTARGDLPMPLKITCQSPTASQDTMLIAVRTAGDTSSFSPIWEAEGYNARGSGVADLTDANFRGSGAPQGQRWTPPSTTEIMILRWRAGMTNYRVGRFRCFVRCRDNAAATPNIRIRVRAGLSDGTSFQYGDYGDVQKYVTTVGGTTAIAWVDCGTIALPHIDIGNSTANYLVLELWAKATSTSTTFDVDYLALYPAYEDGAGGGLVIAKFPVAMGTGAEPLGVVDANDNVADAYLETSSVLQFVASDIKGQPIYGSPNKQFNVWVVTWISSTGMHTQNATNSVVIIGTPRYKLARGS